MRNHKIPEGHTIIYQHLNDANDPNGHARKYLLRYPRKRYPYVTFANLYDKERKIVTAQGMSICGPNDTPSRKRGNSIARGRALKEYYS